jgi:anti-anti-sigma factor
VAVDDVEDFSVEVVRTEGRLVVVVRGELDIATAPDLEKALLDAATGDDVPVFVDLSATSFLDSTGLKVLVHAARQLEDRFTLVCPADHHPVMRVVGFAGFDQAFPVIEAL